MPPIVPVCEQEISVNKILKEAIDATGGPWSESLAGVKNFVDARYLGFPWQERWYAQIRGARAALQILERSVGPETAESGRPTTLPLANEPSRSTAARPSGPPAVGGLSLLSRLVALDWITTNRLERALRMHSILLAACGGDVRAAERTLAGLVAGAENRPEAAAA